MSSRLGTFYRKLWLKYIRNLTDHTLRSYLKLRVSWFFGENYIEVTGEAVWRGSSRYYGESGVGLSRKKWSAQK